MAMLNNQMVILKDTTSVGDRRDWGLRQISSQQGRRMYRVSVFSDQGSWGPSCCARYIADI